MSRSYYKGEMERLLGDTNRYIPLMSNPVKLYKEELFKVSNKRSKEKYLM